MSNVASKKDKSHTLNTHPSIRKGFKHFRSPRIQTSLRKVGFAGIALRSEKDTWQDLGTRRNLSQLWSFKIRRTTVLNYIKFVDLLIALLYNHERADRETVQKVKKALFRVKKVPECPNDFFPQLSSVTVIFHSSPKFI